MGSSRLDARLVEAGLAATRSRARDLVVRGFVRVDGLRCDKPGRDLGPGARVELTAGAPDFVSRGAEKLIGALDTFGFEPDHRVALDVGASTGGFVQVLLQRGAAKVYAVDVGHQQLHSDLRRDPRVICLEKCDARTLNHDIIAEPVAAIVADVSFISLTKVLQPALRLACPGAWLVALIKPQFEVGPQAVARGGIVRDLAERDRAVEIVSTWLANQPGWSVRGLCPSPIRGGSGNEEFLIGAVCDA